MSRKPASGGRPKAKTVQSYTSRHWGHKPTKVWEVGERLFPELAQMGTLIQISAEDDDGEFTIKFGRGSHVGYTPDRTERLYLPLSAKDKTKVKRLVASVHARSMPLSEASKLAGGRQGRIAWPLGAGRVVVKPLGWAHELYYATSKRGDPDGSTYCHELGEESGMRPLLCGDSLGRLWLAGGNYTVPAAGITD